MNNEADEVCTTIPKTLGSINLSPPLQVADKNKIDLTGSLSLLFYYLASFSSNKQ